MVLVVERDPHVRELEAFFLREAGYAVQFALDGNEAIALAQELRPDVVITEVLVPGCDGLSVCRTIKADPGLAETRVLVFSFLAVSQRAREAGADAFLLKPLAEKSLLRTVRELLRMEGE